MDFTNVHKPKVIHSAAQLAQKAFVNFRQHDWELSGEKVSAELAATIGAEGKVRWYKISKKTMVCLVKTDDGLGGHIEYVGYDTVRQGEEFNNHLCKVRSLYDALSQMSDMQMVEDAVTDAEDAVAAESGSGIGDKLPAGMAKAIKDWSEITLPDLPPNRQYVGPEHAAITFTNCPEPFELDPSIIVVNASHLLDTNGNGDEAWEDALSQLTSIQAKGLTPKFSITGEPMDIAVLRSMLKAKGLGSNMVAA